MKYSYTRLLMDQKRKLKDNDIKQKEYLRSLGYSENVINALFPVGKEEVFLDNGQNLITGFEVVLAEKEINKNME